MKNNKYVLNIENVMNFIFDSNAKRNTDSEITEVYVSDEEDENKLSLSTKQIREVKGSDLSSIYTIKYDMFKNFLDIIVDMDSKENATFGEEVIYNTMVNEELITEVNN